jgi:NADPH-dependent 7-cyano-7-deazaguanine reductase QueF
MTILEAVPEKAAGTIVTAGTPMEHLCPHQDETDQGHVTVAWETTDVTLELHSLAAYLKTWANEKVSHEELTETILRDIGETGVDAVSVTTKWRTAGLDVTVVREA